MPSMLRLRRIPVAALALATCLAAGTSALAVPRGEHEIASSPAVTPLAGFIDSLRSLLDTFFTKDVDPWDDDLGCRPCPPPPPPPVIIDEEM